MTNTVLIKHNEKSRYFDRVICRHITEFGDPEAPSMREHEIYSSSQKYRFWKHRQYSSWGTSVNRDLLFSLYHWERCTLILHLVCQKEQWLLVHVRSIILSWFRKGTEKRNDFLYFDLFCYFSWEKKYFMFREWVFDLFVCWTGNAFKYLISFPQSPKHWNISFLGILLSLLWSLKEHSPRLFQKESYS